MKTFFIHILMLKLLKYWRNGNPTMVLWHTSKTIQLIWQHFVALDLPSKGHFAISTFCHFLKSNIYKTRLWHFLTYCVTSYRISPHFLLVHGDRSQRNTIVFCIRNTFLLLLSEKYKNTGDSPIVVHVLFCIFSYQNL